MCGWPAVCLLPWPALDRLAKFAHGCSPLPSPVPRYGCLPFFLAESAVELPWLMAKTLCFSVIVYFGIGFISSAAKFWFFTLALTLIYLMFTYFGEQPPCVASCWSWIKGSAPASAHQSTSPHPWPPPTPTPALPPLLQACCWCTSPPAWSSQTRPLPSPSWCARCHGQTPQHSSMFTCSV